jgi:hypothetical protein
MNLINWIRRVVFEKHKPQNDEQAQNIRHNQLRMNVTLV